ncbi:hypothetical protein BV20DRAFT_693502 [Pilatotrama ljubarskyi]|nr:hypothetical protein BV20DRAFT_693502 [Pilatotrama ljubarskyi]
MLSLSISYPCRLLLFLLAFVLRSYLAAGQDRTLIARLSFLLLCRCHRRRRLLHAHHRRRSTRQAQAHVYVCLAVILHRSGSAQSLSRPRRRPMLNGGCRRNESGRDVGCVTRKMDGGRARRGRPRPDPSGLGSRRGEEGCRRARWRLETPDGVPGSEGRRNAVRGPRCL